MGNEVTTLEPQDPNIVNTLKKNTPFTYTETEQIVRRYRTLDQSDSGSDGIPLETCLMIPEFTGNALAPDVIEFHADKSGNISAQAFMKICTLFSRRTPAQKKKEFLFNLFDTHKKKLLGYDEMFRIYKLFLSHAVSDDHIVALVYSALHHPRLEKDGEVTRNEFIEMVSDKEIQERLSIDFSYIAETKKK